jgi:tetratricopeptide (TPR) repeat protein
MPEKLDLPPEIERYYEKWKKDPRSRIFAQLADAYRKNGMLDEAIQICLQGLNIHPSYGSARMVLARAYQEKGQDLEAEREFLEIISNDPNNLLANRLLGDLLHKGGRIQQALEQYQRVLKLTPLDREIRETLEKIEASLEPSAAPLLAATEELKEKTEEAPQEALREEVASILEGERERTPDAALKPQDKKEDAFLTETVADLYLKQGLYDQAAEIFFKMLASDPNNSHLQERLQEAFLLREGQEGPTAAPAVALEEPESKFQADLPTAEAWPESFLLSPGDELDEGLLGGAEIDFDQFQGTPAPSPSRAEPIQVLNRWLEAVKKRRQLRDEAGLS